MILMMTMIMMMMMIWILLINQLLGRRRVKHLDGSHVVEGVVQLLADGLVLQFLGVQLILQVINGLLKLGDGSLSELSTSLSLLQLICENLDLLLVLVLLL